MKPCGRQKPRKIGPLDKRLRVRRCEQCRIRRTKCEGGRPCEACKDRLTTCRGQASQEAAQVVTITKNRPIAMTSTPDKRFTSTITSVECIAVVNQFVGETPSPITDLFSTAKFLRWYREDSSIRAVIAYLGKASTQRGRQAAAVQKSGMFMEREQRELYATIQARLQRPDPHLDQPLLLLVNLFFLLQMMTNRSINIIIQIIDQVIRNIVQLRGSRGFSTQIDKSALSLFRIFEGYACLLFESCTTFKAEWCKSVIDVQKSGTPSGRAHNMSLFECICTFYGSMADCNAQSRAWIQQEEEFIKKPSFKSEPTDHACSIDVVESTYAEHLAVGQGIIRQVSEVLDSIQAFENIVRESKSVQDPSYDMFMSHSFYFRAYMVRLFAHPLWQNPRISKETLQESRVLEYAKSALDHIERRMQHAGLDAYLYIDQLVMVGIELKHSLDRLRVMSLLHAIKGQGFIVADVYIEDLQLAWNAVPPCRSSYGVELPSTNDMSEQ